jgi:hypothetical protein
MEPNICAHCGGVATGREMRTIQVRVPNKGWRTRHQKETGRWWCEDCITKLRDDVPLDQIELALDF